LSGEPYLVAQVGESN